MAADRRGRVAISLEGQELYLSARALPDATAELVDKIVSTVGSVAIDKVSIIDSGGQGTGVPGFMGQLPAAVISLAEQLEDARRRPVQGAPSRLERRVHRC